MGPIHSAVVRSGSLALLVVALMHGGVRAADAQVVAASTTAAAGQMPAPTAKKPPFPNRANSVLPSWLRVRGEFRERAEGFDGFGFTPARDDFYFLSRLRLNATVAPSSLVSFQTQLQDARVADKTVGPTTTPFRAPLDVRMAFADIGTAKSRVAVRVGRQELAYGDQRLVGHVSWVNAARTFDGAKVTLRRKALSVDLFATSVVRILETQFDKSGAGNRFAGAYATVSSLVPKASVEPYAFWKRDRNVLAESGTRGTLDIGTFGVRWVGQLPGRFEYNTDTAVQTGSVASDAVRTWAGHYQLRSAPYGSTSVRLVSEFNYASGDRTPNDGTRGTFDQLYPTPHDKYGLADQVGWRNIQHLRAGVELTPAKNLPITASYHSFWLAQKRDGLYAANGTLLARVAAGAASAHVGQEVDVQVSRALTPQLQLAGGYAYLAPGAFLKQATPGASYSYPYVMATYVFLAER